MRQISILEKLSGHSKHHSLTYITYAFTNSINEIDNYFYSMARYSGYMSPEYAMDGIFSVKSDVFSFGVLVLEIISGKKNRGVYAVPPHENLVAHVSQTLACVTFVHAHTHTDRHSHMHMS